MVESAIAIHYISQIYKLNHSQGAYHANLLTPSAPTRISAAAPAATALPAIRFCRLNSCPKVSFVVFFSARRAARSCLTASLRAFFSSVDSPRGRLMVSD